jgi:phenylpyruvate tautomerase PptA (4-oxalocrotonate tautomerase family)
MPLVDVEIVLKPQETLPEAMASELADKLGQLFGSPRNGTWVKVRGIDEVSYAENGGKKEGVYPVFVTILKAKLPDSEALQTEVDAVIAAVGQICQRTPSLVHVIYQPEGKGRVAFGGRIVT